MKPFLIFIIFLFQGCSAVYKKDYFTAESNLEYDEVNHCNFTGGGVGIKNYGEPDRAVKLVSNDVAISVCSKTKENQKTITMGPLFFPIIPIFSTQDDSDSLFTVTLRLASKDKSLTIKPTDSYLITADGKRIHIFNHTKGVASKCYNQVGYADVNKNIVLTNTETVDFCFEREDIGKSKYTLHLDGLYISDKKLPKKTIIFKRLRSTFFAFAG